MGGEHVGHPLPGIRPQCHACPKSDCTWHRLCQAPLERQESFPFLSWAALPTQGQQLWKQSPAAHGSSYALTEWLHSERMNGCALEPPSYQDESAP